MKLNKTLAFAALIAGSLLAGGALAQAQDATTASTNAPTGGPAGGGPRPRGMMNVDNLARRLDLTDDEKTNVAAALNDFQQKLRELRQDTSVSAEDKRAQSKQLREDLNAKMKDILTSDQDAQWLKISTPRRRPAPTPPPADGASSTNAPAPAN